MAAPVEVAPMVPDDVLTGANEGPRPQWATPSRPSVTTPEEPTRQATGPLLAHLLPRCRSVLGEGHHSGCEQRSLSQFAADTQITFASRSFLPCSRMAA